MADAAHKLKHRACVADSRSGNGAAETLFWRVECGFLVQYAPPLMFLLQPNPAVQAKRPGYRCVRSAGDGQADPRPERSDAFRGDCFAPRAMTAWTEPSGSPRQYRGIARPNEETEP
jgi:hypothetical protein